MEVFVGQIVAAGITHAPVNNGNLAVVAIVQKQVK